MIRNNNITCTSPDGRVFYTHWHWLNNFLNLLNSDYKQAYYITKGVFDGKPKAEVKCLKFIINPISNVGEVYDTLNKGGEVEFKGWKFITV